MRICRIAESAEACSAVITFLAQFLPFYDIYGYEGSLFSLLDRLLEVPSFSGCDEDVAIATLYLPAILSAIIYLICIFVFAFTDSFGFAIASILFSAGVQAYLPFKILISENEFLLDDGLTTMFLPLYFVLSTVTFVLLLKYGSLLKKYY